MSSWREEVKCFGVVVLLVGVVVGGLLLCGGSESEWARGLARNVENPSGDPAGLVLDRGFAEGVAEWHPRTEWGKRVSGWERQAATVEPAVESAAKSIGPAPTGNLDNQRMAGYDVDASWKEASRELGAFSFYTKLFRPRPYAPRASFQEGRKWQAEAGLIRGAMMMATLARDDAGRFRKSYADGCVTRQGYRLVKVAGKWITEHRAVWQEHYGPLTKDQHLHHVNGDKLDNRIENLEVHSNSEHRKMHEAVIHADGFRSIVYRESAGVAEKLCSRCGRWLTREHFGPGRNPGGWRSECYECRRRERR